MELPIPKARGRNRKRNKNGKSKNINRTRLAKEIKIDIINIKNHFVSIIFTILFIFLKNNSSFNIRLINFPHEFSASWKR